jgi:hypothetical protein
MNHLRIYMLSLFCVAGIADSFAHSTQAQGKELPKKKIIHKPAPKNLYPIDRIEAVIFGNEVSDVVTLSDIQRVGLDGRFKSKDEHISDRLIFVDSMRYRITVDEKTVDDYIDKVVKTVGGTIDDVKAMFTEAGYTYEEGRRQFAMMYASNQAIDFRVRSRLIVPERLVIEYYEKNPIMIPAVYTFERAFFALPADQIDEMKKKIEQYRKTGKGLAPLWIQLPEISEEDIASEKQSLTQLHENEISAPQQVAGGIEIFMLKYKKPAHAMPLDERYRDIVELLRRPKFEEILADYKKELFNSASILYF